MQSVGSPKKVACPTCGDLSDYSPANPWRPFCSQRCKLIDLGQWATEGYRIPQNDKQHQDPTDD